MLFAARCYALRGLCRKIICSSVRPSVTRRYSVDTGEHILRLFLSPGSHTILDFPYQTLRKYCYGHPANGGGGRRMQGDMKKLRFSTNLKNGTRYSFNGIL